MVAAGQATVHPWLPRVRLPLRALFLARVGCVMAMKVKQPVILFSEHGLTRNSRELQLWTSTLEHQLWAPAQTGEERYFVPRTEAGRVLWLQAERERSGS